VALKSNEKPSEAQLPSVAVGKTEMEVQFNDIMPSVATPDQNIICIIDA
jgi:hypothetical protein